MGASWRNVRQRRLDLSEAGLQRLERNGANARWGYGIQHLEIPVEVLERLRRIEDVNVQAGLLAHPSTPAAQVWAAARTKDGLAHGAARVEHVPGVADSLARHEKVGVRLTVAGNPTTSPDMLMVLAGDVDADVRAKVAGRKDLAPEVAHLLVGDADPTVRFELIQNPGTPGSVLHQMVIGGSRHDWESAARNPSLPAETILWLSQQPCRDLLAGNPSSPVELLDDLYATGDPEVLQDLAHNPTTRLEHLHAIMDLALEDDDYLYALSSHPQLPDSVLLRMPPSMIRPLTITSRWDVDKEAYLSLSRNWQGNVKDLLEALELVKR